MGLFRDRLREGVVALTAAFVVVFIGSRIPGWDTARLALIGTIAGVIVLTFWEFGRHGLLGNLDLSAKYQRPRWSGRRQLRQDTLALVKELHAHVQSQPSSMARSHAEHFAMAAASKAAKDEAEAAEIWNRYTAKTTERYERERQEIAERFGGKILAVVEQYHRRGVIDDQTRTMLLRRSTSLSDLSETASTLEAWARQL